MNTHFTGFNHTANTQEQTQNRHPVYHIHLTLFLSLLLCLTLIQDRKSPSKAQFADCVLQAGFVIVSLHINILCLHLFFLPSLLPPLHHPPSLPRSSAVGAEPLIKSLRQKLLSSEYQVSAFRQEQHWQERGRVGEGEARMTRKPAAVRGEEAGVPSDSHDCYCCIENMVVV